MIKVKNTIYAKIKDYFDELYNIIINNINFNDINDKFSAINLLELSLSVKKN